MGKTVSAAEAKTHFAECLRTVEHGQAVVITRHGKAVAALVPAAEAAQFDRLRAAGPQAGLAGLAGGWDDSEELVQQLAQLRRTPPRRPSRLVLR